VLYPSQLQVTLHWQALAAPGADYTAFVHLLAGDGSIATQSDAVPGDPAFPTSSWLPAAQVVDRHTLTLPADLTPGDYILVVGLYQPPTGPRLPATDAQGVSLGDAVPLTTITLAPPAP